ncbi:MAG: response regulator [Hyphomonadaceae bacterium]|nr:response regulator [Hyphomonadaceae bacterium]MCA8885421.1 response regulator [Hyphomonadaceae bacterium]
MSDLADTPAPHSGGRLDPLQILFWFSVAVGLGAAGVALTAGQAVGQAGAVLLILLAAAGLVLFFWMSRGAGRRVGAFPERGAIAANSLLGGRNDFAFVEALDEAAMITDAHLSPLTANHSYLEIAEAAGILGESDRPPMMSRLFGADPMLSAPMFRLSKAAQLGQTRREELPATAAINGKHTRYEACVGPIPGGQVLWRLRELGVAEQGASPDDGRQLFLDDSPVGFFAAKSDGQIIYMNRSLRAVLGLGDDPQLLRVKDMIKEDASRLIRRDRRGFGPSRAKVTLKGIDGQETQASVLSFTPVDDIDGAVRGLVFFSEAESPESAVVTRSVDTASADGVFAQAPFGVAVLDGIDPGSCAVLDSNAALMEMTQGRATPSAAFADLFEASEGPAALAHRLRQALNDPIEITLATAPPTAVHVQLARGADGRALAYISNVSQQRELETRLAQSEKMREIGELAAGVAHDFNNLLTVVMQTCSYLLRRHPVGDADYPMLKEIADHATTAKELSEMLRAYARQQNFAREVFDVGDFLGSKQELIRRVMGASIQTEIRHGRDLPYVKVDKTQLERVVVNLATNARDAMTPKGSPIARDGKLMIRTSVIEAASARAMGHTPMEDGKYVMIEVEDTGGGIKPEHAAKIFRPYHSTKEAGKGTGLGLATSYGIIKQSGGYIFFTSKVGVGTTFRIFLPEYTPTQEELDEIAEKERALIAPPPKDVSGRGKILFVEDLVPVRRATVRNLKECGYEVEEAGDGQEALDILTAKPGAFDIIISDVSMPIMTGPEMLEEAEPSMIGNAKVLFLSGYAPESFSDVLEKYPVHYLSKPVTMEQLVGRVKELLAAA